MIIAAGVFDIARAAEWQAFDARLTTLRHQGQLTPASSMESLLGQLTASQKALVQAFLDIDLSKHGIATPYLGLEATPADLVVLREGHPSSQAADYNTTAQYLPRPAAAAFQRLRDGFAADHPGRRILLASGYRSPAFQIATLTSYFVRFHHFDIGSTLTQVALPGCSQHCSASRTALDLATVGGQPSDADGQDFAKTVEYGWLKAHAADYGFHESYPPDNPEGIMWEPWHWQYLPKQ